MTAPYRSGEVVVYRVQKCSVHPGSHAVDVQPAPNGDDYTYAVEKYWRVVEVRPDNSLVVRTRKGKERTVLASDPNLRRPSWLEWLFQYHRFPSSSIEELEEARQGRPG